ncbi:MAG: metal ABC transporter permease [Brevinema sp.]
MFEFEFFRNAIMISLILSFLFTLISFIIVTRRLSFLAIGTEHAAFGGMGLANFLGWDPFLTTSVFCAALTIIAGKTHKKSADTGTSLFFSGAMALGMVLLAINTDNTFNMMGFLFGDLVGITSQDLLIGAIVTILVYAFFLPLSGKILYISFDRDSALVSGVRAGLLDTIIYGALSVSIILGIRLVGVLLVAAMTILPASFALLWQKNLTITLIISFFYTIFSMVMGILLSIQFDVAPGALIVLTAVIVYLFSKFIILGSKRG